MTRTWVHTDNPLYEEPGWYLLKAGHVPGKSWLYSVIYHVCTQMETHTAGQYKGQRQWVEEEKVVYTCVRTDPRSLELPCKMCGFKAPEHMRGLWLLHNFDAIQGIK